MAWKHYLKIDPNASHTIIERLATVRTLESNTNEANPYWVPADVIGYGSATNAQVLDGPIGEFTPGAERGTLTYTLRDKTAAELNAELKSKKDEIEQTRIRTEELGNQKLWLDAQIKTILESNS